MLPRWGKLQQNEDQVILVLALIRTHQRLNPTSIHIDSAACSRYSTDMPAIGPESKFDVVNKNLEEVVSKLKATNDPEARRLLFREMRQLVTEAEAIAFKLSPSITPLRAPD